MKRKLEETKELLESRDPLHHLRDYTLTITADPPYELKACRYMLATQSSYWSTRLSSDFAHKNTIVPIASRDAYHFMLEWLHCPKTWNQLVEASPNDRRFWTGVCSIASEWMLDISLDDAIDELIGHDLKGALELLDETAGEVSKSKSTLLTALRCEIGFTQPPPVLSVKLFTALKAHYRQENVLSWVCSSILERKAIASEEEDKWRTPIQDVRARL